MLDNNHILGGIVVTGALIVGALFMSPIKQRVFIHPDLSLSKNNLYIDKLDTIVADNSRWYYNQKDSTLKNIRISFYKDKINKPYEVVSSLEPDDYFDVKMKQGLNVVHIDQLGTYPTLSKRILIYKIDEKK